MGNYIANRIAEGQAKRRGEEARRRALALIALGDANPTDDELRGYKPGVPIDLQPPGQQGAEPSALGLIDPALIPDARQQQRNEALQRAEQQSRPAVTQFRKSLAFQDAGLNENTLAQAQVHRAQAADQETRNAPVAEILANPDANPLLKIDVANKRDVFKSSLAKVTRADGTQVYMNATPTLSGKPTFTPALDEDGAPLRAPVSAAAGGRPTSLASNAKLLARTMYAHLSPAEAETAAVERLTSLKTMTPQEAWNSIRREVTRLQGGKYVRDPQRLYDKIVEQWRISRPMEAIPAEVPGLVTPPPLGSGVPPRPGTPAKPAAAQTEHAPADSAARKAGQVYTTPRGPMRWTGTGWLPAN